MDLGRVHAGGTPQGNAGREQRIKDRVWASCPQLAGMDYRGLSQETERTATWGARADATSAFSCHQVGGLGLLQVTGSLHTVDG